MIGPLKAISSFTVGQLAAFVHKVAKASNMTVDQVIQLVLEYDIAVEIRGIIAKLFDKNGRRIPPWDLRSSVYDANRKYYLDQPKLENLKDYQGRLARQEKAFQLKASLTAEKFYEQTSLLIKKLVENESFANLLKGVHLPIILPQLPKEFDYGTLLEELFLPAVERAYQKEFPGGKFYNYRKGKLAQKVGIVEGSCHEQLIERMKEGPVVAIYFPNPLQGFSVNASREQMETLPESLILAGGFDTATALVMYPDVLAGDWHIPSLHLAALSWQSVAHSLCFGVSGAWADRLDFVHTGMLDFTEGRSSGGLLFLG